MLALDSLRVCAQSLLASSAARAAGESVTEALLFLISFVDTTISSGELMRSWDRTIEFRSSSGKVMRSQSLVVPEERMDVCMYVSKFKTWGVEVCYDRDLVLAQAL